MQLGRVVYHKGKQAFAFVFVVVFFLIERDRAQAGKGERERETQNPKRAPGSELSAQSPTRGSDPQTRETMT